ncbi:MAG TPA: ABC transporter ATP-binding protein [Bryobacteraceae bacterium]|nr:ABC transporter ATP-binding protein [Bryobacteraceae bacterium]
MVPDGAWHEFKVYHISLRAAEFRGERKRPEGRRVILYNAGLNDTAAVRLDGVTRSFESYTAVAGITLEVRSGKFVSIVGPSGCGKSTILSLAAGLLAPSSGTVAIFGEPLIGINRRASYMFQQDALLPWKTVLDNIALGPVLRGVPREQARQKAAEWVQRVGLDGFADRYPYQLSGGMRKRAAMAQSWIVDPDIVLMDEPFSALDIHTRLRMESEVLAIWAGSSKTVVFVTHDLEEAIALSDEVIVLSAGPASHIVGVYAVDLVRPRNLIDIKLEPRFAELYRSIWTDLRGEVLKSYAKS